MSTQDTTAAFSAVAVGAVWGERQLAADLRAGSAEAFNYLITLYHKPLHRFVCRLVNDADDAADITQEVFLRVFRAAAQFQGKSSIKTWMYQIALHEASNHRRWWRRHKQQESSLEGDDSRGWHWAERLPDGGDSPLRQAERSELRSQLKQALDAVPQPFRAALVLREVEGFSYDEIAEVTQSRIGTVKSRILRAREMLRQQWMERGA